MLTYDVKANGVSYLKIEVEEEATTEEIENIAESQILALDPPPVERRKIICISVDPVEMVVEILT